jgi:hypothetical protein
MRQMAASLDHRQNRARRSLPDTGRRCATTPQRLERMKKAHWLVSGLLAVALAHPSCQATAVEWSGVVVDDTTQRPIYGAVVTLGEASAVSATDGTFNISGEGTELRVRAVGYARSSTAIIEDLGKSHRVELKAFRPKALYLSFYGIGDAELRNAALELIATTELNALVIDIKGDRGLVAHKSQVPLAEQVGAQRIRTIPDLKGLLARLREKAIYSIARIVVYKDNPLATARPDLAVKSADGRVWRDRENLAWSDPFRSEVWAYNTGIAEEAAASGFDEIQFDYVRFPDARGLTFSEPNTEAARIGAIDRFLSEARAKLSRYNVFVAADLFGYTCWNLDDTGIGQKLESMVKHLDYVSPMLYPSGFQYGIPDYPNPVQHPYEVVLLSLRRAAERTALPPVRFRPWLQAFKDYAYDKREFTGFEIRRQIMAAEAFGSNGWMLWNPRNVYTAAGLQAE